MWRALHVEGAAGAACVAVLEIVHASLSVAQARQQARPRSEQRFKECDRLVALEWLAHDISTLTPVYCAASPTGQSRSCSRSPVGPR